MADRTQALYHLADELRGIARLGLVYAQNDHDRDRYERVLAVAARLAAAAGGLPDDRAAGVLEAFRANLAHVSPNYRLRVPVVLQVLRGERPLPYIDLPASPRGSPE